MPEHGGSIFMPAGLPALNTNNRVFTEIGLARTDQLGNEKSPLTFYAITVKSRLNYSSLKIICFAR
jgi:hypothetical protein